MNEPALLRSCAERGLRCPAPAPSGGRSPTPGGRQAIPPRLGNRGRMKRPRPKKTRRPKGFRARRPGGGQGLGHRDRHPGGVRRTLFGCLDRRSRFALTPGTPRFSSQRTGDFFDPAPGLFPGRVDRAPSDNGSEFEEAFARLSKAKEIGCCCAYPRSPKRNAHLERSDRTAALL